MGLFKKKNNQPVVEPKEKIKEHITITTTDEINKLDGVLKIADLEGSKITMTSSKLPYQIDVNKRKQDFLLKKKEMNEKRNPQYKKIRRGSTFGAILAVVLIIGFIVLYNYIQNIERPEDYKLKDITLELGDKLPQNVSYYLFRENIDEQEYTLNLSTVKEYKIGTYNYYVEAFGVKKSAKINVVDTTPPSVEIEAQYIELNQTFNENLFVEYCYDLSSCNFSFDDKTITEKNQLVGEYEVLLTISDEYNNFIKKNTKLYVVDKYEELTCTKTNNKTSSIYEREDVIKIKYVNDQYKTHTYQVLLNYYNQENYLNDKEEYLSTEEYNYKDELNQIIINERYILNQNLSLTDATNQIINDGYTCK